MNILFLDQFSEPGGAQLCLKDLMPEVLRRGWNPCLMAPGEGELVTWAQRAGIPAEPLPLGSYTSGRKTARDFLRFMADGPRMAKAVRGAMRRHRVDMVYVNGPRALPAVAALASPVVFHAHSHVGRRAERALVDWSVRSSGACVIAASEFVARPYREATNPKRVHVIYNGVADLQRSAADQQRGAADQQRRAHDFARRPPRIGILGRIAREKGHADFVKAAKQIAASGSAAEFLVYGDKLFGGAAFDAEVRAMARDLPVNFCGWTDNVAAALGDLEILAVPSGPEEAATRVILEAFSAGTPVVAYRSGGIPEIIEDKRTGILAAAADSASLAESLLALMNDPPMMERLAAAGRREWQRRFKVERFRSAICDLLENEVRAFSNAHSRRGWRR